MIEFKLPPELQEIVDRVRSVRCNAATAKRALGMLDYTALTGEETNVQLQAMCRDANRYGLAAICVLPHYIEAVKEFLGPQTRVQIATVVNFPDGDKRTGSNEPATPETTAEDVSFAIAQGASQIDIVLDFNEFLLARFDQDEDRLIAIGELLKACKEATRDAATMKVIIGTAAFRNYNDLKDACAYAAQFDPHCLKSDTGKHPNGGVTLEKAAVILNEAQKAGLGAKLSAGITDEHMCAQIIAMAQIIMGPTEIDHQWLKFGASGVLSKLVACAHFSDSQPGQTEALPPAPLNY